MDFYGRKNLWKFILLIFAILIGAATLLYTETFLRELRKQEVNRVNQFADAIHNILNAGNKTNITFEKNIIRSNTTIPIIITDEEGNLVDARNVDTVKQKNPEWIKREVARMGDEIPPIEIDIGRGQKQYLYYQNSILLTKLRYYPIILLFVISLFIGIAYIAFSNARKSEQNQVWNGLAKETAHQIGTPLTSLMGWIELLRNKEGTETMVEEMEKDVQRLNTIAERFSKIGSKPAIKPQNIEIIAREAVSYLQVRSPKKVEITFKADPGMEDASVLLNKPLFEWVIENLVRNAIDAVEGHGKIAVRLTDQNKRVKLEVEDNGKGIPANKQKAIFRPGYSTKSRGWGLGLSLAKRIIEEYHGGRIYVSHSELGKGTTFRISLTKAEA